MQTSASYGKRVVAAAAGALMLITGVAATSSPAHAGPKKGMSASIEEMSAAIRHLDADTARKKAELARLKKQGAVADARGAAADARGAAADKVTNGNEASLACYDKLNQTIVAEGGVAKLSPARRAQLRAVRNQCDALASG